MWHKGILQYAYTMATFSQMHKKTPLKGHELGMMMTVIIESD